MTDHRIDIRSSAEDHTEYLRDAISEGTEFEYFLDIEHYKSNHDNHRIEFLLTCGGPTVRVEVDIRWNSVTFHHSWGMDANGDDCHEIEIYGDEREPWLQVAETVIECA